MKLMRQSLNKRPKHVAIQKIRRTATQVQLYDVTIPVKQWCNQADFTLKQLNVLVTLTAVSRDDTITATVEARTQAVGNMHVQ